MGANESKLSEFRRDPISLPKGFETRSAPALLTASTLVAFTLITHTASCLRQLPSCVAVYPRDSRRDVFYVAFPKRSIVSRSLPLVSTATSRLHRPCHASRALHSLNRDVFYGVHPI